MMPQDTLNLLEFNKLLEIIAGYSRSDASRNAILSITPLSDKKEIKRRFSCIEEIGRMSQIGAPLSILPFNDIAPCLQKIYPKDSILEPSELVWVMDFLSASRDAAMRIKADTSLASLNELTLHLTGQPELLRILNKSIDRDGNILDSASPVLAELRAEKRRLENRIRKRLEEMVRDEKTSVFLQDDFITQRSGRWVIPVRMDSKGQVHGVVHDVSRTGETAFIEPIEIIGISNELENIIADEKGEMIRILRDIASRIREKTDEIEAEFGILVFLDLLNSIAMLAQEFRMQTPEINDENIVHLSKARHPLLLHAAMQKKNPPRPPFSKGGLGGLPDEVIPIDVHLGGNKQVMVITGPNAGGKTVTLKTIGILSVMALSGMPIPADASSTISLFQNFLVDIGDRQSIADNLSTFTAHLTNMIEFLNKADSKTVVLIDELGTGTDPEEGAALACTILKELKEKGSLIFATTHLTDVKVFVHREESMVNASMEFSQKTFAPLYRLRTGEPGQSFAIETAKRYGLPDRAIESARMMLGKRRADLENLIHDLEQKRMLYEEAVEEFRGRSKELREKEDRINGLLIDAESLKKEALAKAYREASEIISRAKRDMHLLIEEIKKTSQEKAKELLKEVSSAQAQVFEKMKEYEVAAEPISMDELSEGDVVFIKSLGYDATIAKLIKKKNRLKVKAGSFEMEVAISDVGLKKGKGIETGRRAAKPVISEEEATPNQLNIIGLRVDDAIPLLEKFLNHATLAGLSEVTIIHGIGTGILSRSVREHLSGHPLVKGFRGGEQAEGGAGVTVVGLK